MLVFSNSCVVGACGVSNVQNVAGACRREIILERSLGPATDAQKPGGGATSEELVAQLRAKLLTRSEERGREEG